MDQIDRRVALRTQFMNELYDIAQGAVGQPTATSAVVERIGFDFNNNDEHRQEISDIVNYLDQKNLSNE